MADVLSGFCLGCGVGVGQGELACSSCEVDFIRHMNELDALAAAGLEGAEVDNEPKEAEDGDHHA